MRRAASLLSLYFPHLEMGSCLSFKGSVRSRVRMVVALAHRGYSMRDVTRGT